ncbi:MAG: 4Fe-4S dicluster domain-containing protein [Chloroflexi bacterium]|nr:4Fe-4S dicluster domain-containing protein [Chloroflexota bacterium]
MPSREIFWNISPEYIIYILAVIALAIMTYSIYRRYKLWRVGRQDDRSKNMGKRILVFIRTAIIDALIHRRFLSEPYPGIMHLLIFWGCLILLIATAVDAVTHLIHRELAGSIYLWFSLFSDIAGIMVLTGIIMAGYRRYIQKPERLNTVLDDGVVITLALLVIITGFAVEGLRQAATELVDHPDWAVWSPGGWIFAKILANTSDGALVFWHRFLWWFHSILVIGGVVYFALRFSKIQHIIISPLNVFFRTMGPLGAPAPLQIETAETFGVGDSKEFTWKQLLDVDACTNCGRCQDACPAWLSEKPLSPRKLTQDIKSHWLQTAHKPVSNRENEPPRLIGDMISENEIWACTTCGACQEACPVYVEHIVKIIDLRRNLVLVQGKMPESAQIMLRNMQTRGHPWAGAQSLRLRGDWMSGLDLKIIDGAGTVDMLFWVGCTGALVERNVNATISLVKVLQAAGVNFGVLGETENCCGDPARRAGYDFQFQIMAEQNIEIFKGHNITQIVTACPHCYNAFKNEYPQYGGNFKVVHYTQLIADLMEQGRLKLTNQLASALCYHDPCYLGRYNSEYSAPRKILRGIPGLSLREMERSYSRSFCCGGGGGHLWIEELPGTRISEIRINDVLKSGADTVVTACPYCLQMMEEAIESKQIKESLKAMDMAELVENAIRQSQ